MESSFVYSPQIIRETSSGLERYDVRDQMLANRELELTSQVDASSCAGVIRNLLFLEREDADAPPSRSSSTAPGARCSRASHSMTSCRR